MAKKKKGRKSSPSRALPNAAPAPRPGSRWRAGLLLLALAALIGVVLAVLESVKQAASALGG